MADQINVNAIANTLQTKVDLPDGVSQGQCDFVIARKAPTAQDPTWYRRYKSGWVEQGGYYIGSTDGWVVQPLLIPMRDTNYSVIIERSRKTDTADPGTGGLDRRCFFTNNYTTTSFNMWGIWATYPCNWEVKGFAATTGSGEGDESTLGNVYKTYFYTEGKPDYTHGENKTAGQTYTATANGILEVWTTKDGTGGATTTITVNGVAINYTVDNYGKGAIYRNLSVGDTYSASSSGVIYSMKFFPYDTSSPSTDITITTLINAIYPIGSIYIGTTVNCPLASIVGTWEKIDENLVLQSSSQSHQAGTTIAAGLPNIAGNVAKWNNGLNLGVSGPFYVDGSSSGTRYLAHSSDSPSQVIIKFNAARCSSVYGNSDTVQPPAYVVNIWKRIA